MEVPPDKAREVLISLGFDYHLGENGAFSVVAPYWRSDIKIAADVIEEIARIIGYEAIPYSRLPMSLPEFLPSPMLPFKRRARRIMQGFDFIEHVSYCTLPARAPMEKRA
jgi:phenylalanyl-tRNA synthetase beta chain